MEEWKEYKLGDVCSRLRSGRGIKSDHVFGTGLYPVIGGNGIRGYANESNFKGECAVIGRQGAYCGNVRFFEGEAFMTEHAVVVVGNELTDTRFLAYLLSLMNLGNLSAQSAQPGLSVQTLSKQIIRLPSIKYQRHISAVIKSLDDKIDCNRRINDNLPWVLWMTHLILLLFKRKNDNLEQQAQALFKSWFVDFEPFKDGEFVESELGMIPKGWKVGKLGELCQFKRGKNLLSKDAVDGGIPVVAGGLEPSCYHNVSNTKSPVVTVSGSGANAGFMRMYHQEVWASDCSFIDSTCDNLLFVYCFLATHRRLLRHAQTGAVQPHVKPADIHDFDIVIPPADVIVVFQKVIAPSIQTKGKNEQESRRLAQLRDTLLPKLMSGELKTTM